MNIKIGDRVHFVYEEDDWDEWGIVTSLHEADKVIVKWLDGDESVPTRIYIDDIVEVERKNAWKGAKR